jgi:hypothetical protein
MGNDEIYHISWDGRQWTLPENVSHTTGMSSSPALVVAPKCVASPDGALHAVWADTTPGYSVIYHGQRDEDFWSSMPIPNARGAMPAVTITPGGEVCVAWQDRLEDTSCYEIFCAIFDDNHWNLPTAVSDSPSQHSIFVKLAANAQGGCHLVWQEEQGGIYQIWHSDRRPNGWAIPVAISATEEDCRLPRIVANRQGFLQVIWLEGHILLHRVRPPDYEATWWDPEVASDECAGLGGLAMAISQAGRVHVAWGAMDASGARQLYYIQREPIFKYTVFLPAISHG